MTGAPANAWRQRQDVAHPDTALVVLDLAMPGTNRVWFREQQLKEPALAHIPVIVFTGSAMVEHLRGLAVADVLSKPSVDARAGQLWRVEAG